MTARCPFCEAVHPVPAEPTGRTLVCACGAIAWLCVPNTEPETAVRMDAMGFRDTFADVLDDRLSIVWGRAWWRWAAAPSL